MPQFARISVNIPQLTGLFDYQVPDNLSGAVKAGCLVAVPFGRQTVQGIVVELIDEPQVADTRLIDALLEPEPVLTHYQMELAKWMANENLTTLPLCLDLMIPAGLSQHADILLKLLPDAQLEGCTPLQTRLVELLKARGALRGRQVDAALPKVNWRESLPALIKKRVIESSPILPPPTVKPRFIRTARLLNPGWKDGDGANLGRPGTPASQRRQAVMEFLEEKAIPVNVSWIYAETGATSADLNLLAENELILLGESELWRDPMAGIEVVLAKSPPLTEDQEHVWNFIQGELTSNEDKKVPNLLEGVTGSGKTEIYLRAVAEVLRAGKGAIILVPEISLTPQTVKRFFARFPGKVGLLHSKLSPGERYDTWRRIRDGVLPIVIGPRSALFAPLPQLGMVVIDECHDGSYHQEDFPPHYHTVDSAVALCRLTNASLILGSATPGVELLYRAEQHGWRLHSLPRRVVGFSISPDESSTGEQPSSPTYSSRPEINVVDMRQELHAGNRSPLSRELKSGLMEVLQRQQQAILFLNRRGSGSYVFCRSCGFVLRCPRCDTQLTYHADEASLLCHGCSYRREMPVKCPQCGSREIRQFGMGTESLEKTVLEHFPSARVLRWDADTTRFKGAHDLILDHFIQHRADILIGTQMLAKGLDLPLVTLVGVVLADISLNLPDFRAAERTYQLLTQVAGRAGRSSLGGRVVLQTFQPEHYAIQFAANYDAEGFKKRELSFRQAAGYPPYSRLVKIEFRHTDPQKTEKAALSAGQLLQNRINAGDGIGTSLIGPVPCFYQKRSGGYRWQILLRGPDPGALLRGQPLNSWQFPGLVVEVTNDPNQLL